MVTIPLDGDSSKFTCEFDEPMYWILLLIQLEKLDIRIADQVKDLIDFRNVKISIGNTQ